MTRYYHPDEFAELKRIALGLGFVHVEAGPLVRSSYHAHEQADAASSGLEVLGREVTKGTKGTKGSKATKGQKGAYVVTATRLAVRQARSSAPR